MSAVAEYHYGLLNVSQISRTKESTANEREKKTNEEEIQLRDGKHTYSPTAIMWCECVIKTEYREPSRHLTIL